MVNLDFGWLTERLLALGINMPFRSTCILGYKDSTEFSTHNYLQMIADLAGEVKIAKGTLYFQM